MKYKVPSKDTLELLLQYEVGGGEKYYTKYLSNFTWPGGYSGPTIAIGIDCAYYSTKELASIFSFLREDEIKLVQQSKGKTGLAGKTHTKILREAGIKVEWDKALEIFQNITWPKYATLAEKAFPGLECFPPDAYGAIVSLVFNRGTKMNGNTRIEMKNIRNLIPPKLYQLIADEIRSMKRLWINKNLTGLLYRREAEAKLIESVI